MPTCEKKQEKERTVAVAPPLVQDGRQRRPFKAFQPFYYRNSGRVATATLPVLEGLYYP